jgi:hypothetical protein
MTRVTLLAALAASTMWLNASQAAAPLSPADTAKLRVAERTCKHVEEWMHRYSNKILRCPGQVPMTVTAAVNKEGKVVPVYKKITCRGTVIDGDPMRIGECIVQENTIKGGAGELDGITERCPNGTKCEFQAEADPINNSVVRIVGSVRKIR